MYYTGINPLTGKPVYVCTDYKEKQLQRALLQYSKPENANLVREALRAAGREDLIGNGEECLVRHAFGQGDNRNGHGSGAYTRGRAAKGAYTSDRGTRSGKNTGGRSRNANNGKKEKAQSAAKKHFYEEVLSSKRPKKSKMERIFGEDYLKIKREGDAAGEGTGQGGGAASAKSRAAGKKPAPKSKKR
jgi:hypothetical protein